MYGLGMVLEAGGYMHVQIAMRAGITCTLPCSHAHWAGEQARRIPQRKCCTFKDAGVAVSAELEAWRHPGGRGADTLRKDHAPRAADWRREPGPLHP
jgi:hypothetical protein